MQTRFPLPTSSVLASVMLAFLLFLSFPALSAQKVTTQAPTGGDFTLFGSQHQTVSLQDFREKLVLLYFGYTTCPDICPTNLSHLANAMRQLTPEEQAQVQVLMITVDPERDTQEKLDTYLPYFHPSFKGLTGDETTIRTIASRYGAVYQKAAIGEGALGYAVDHSAFTYLIDQKGHLVQQLPHATTDETFVRVIRQHIASRN